MSDVRQAPEWDIDPEEYVPQSQPPSLIPDPDPDPDPNQVTRPPLLHRVLGAVTGHTGTSTPGSPRDRAELISQETAALICSDGLGILAGLIAWGVRTRTRTRTLRTPTEDELASVAQPLARLASRHVPAGLLADDALDVLDVVDGVTRWAGAGPVTVPMETTEEI